jgi:hypothetical protein
MPTTPVYALRQQALTDPPNGATLGEYLALDVEDELARIDAAAALLFPISSIATGSVLITPVANAPTGGAVTFGKTLPGTVAVMAAAITAFPGSTVLEVSVNAITATGCTLWIFRTTTTPTTVNWMAIGL